MCNLCKENERKLQIIGNVHVQRHNSVENGSIIPKIELDLDIFMLISIAYQISFQYVTPLQSK